MLVAQYVLFAKDIVKLIDVYGRSTMHSLIIDAI